MQKVLMITAMVLMGFSSLLFSADQVKNPNRLEKVWLAATVDGPANLRVLPNGKVISSLQSGQSIFLRQKKGDWFYTENSKFRGWIHKKNLIDIYSPDVMTKEQAEGLDSAPDVPVDLDNIVFENGEPVSKYLKKP